MSCKMSCIFSDCAGITANDDDADTVVVVTGELLWWVSGVHGETGSVGRSCHVQFI